VIQWLRTLHRWSWNQVRQARNTSEGLWKPITADGTELLNVETVPVTHCLYRGRKIPGS
jgi:RNA-directed DNA polymerase